MEINKMSCKFLHVCVVGLLLGISCHGSPVKLHSFPEHGSTDIANRLSNDRTKQTGLFRMMFQLKGHKRARHARAKHALLQQPTYHGNMPYMDAGRSHDTDTPVLAAFASLQSNMLCSLCQQRGHLACIRRYCNNVHRGRRS